MRHYPVVILLAVVLAACHPSAERLPVAGQARPAATPAPTARPTTPLTYDTVSARHLYVNDQQLWVRRRELRQALGAADSTTTYYDEAARAGLDVSAPDDSVRVFERYGGVFYERIGNELRVLETRPGVAFEVQLGSLRLNERTTAAELQQQFPASYRHRVIQSDGSVHLRLCPDLPCHNSFTLKLRHGRLAGFRQNPS